MMSYFQLVYQWFAYKQELQNTSKYSSGILSGHRETSALARIVYLVHLFTRTNVIDFRIVFWSLNFVVLNLGFVLFRYSLFLYFSSFFKDCDGLRI